MKVADLLLALSELRAGRVTVDQLIAACSAWSNEPTRPLADFLKPAPAVPLAEPASGVLDSFADRRPPAAGRRPAGHGARRGSPFLFFALGVGAAAVLGLILGLAVLGRLNAQLEKANAELEAAKKDLDQARADVGKSEADPLNGRPTSPSPESPREPKVAGKPDPGRASATPATPVPAPRTGEPAKSIRDLEDALAKLRQSAGPDDPRTLKAAADLGRARVEAGRPADALPVLEDVDRRAGNEPWARAARVALAHALRGTGQAARAIEVAERVRDELPENDPLAPEARLQLALAYRAAGKWDRAKPLFLDHLVFARMAGQDRLTADALAWMGECLVRLGDPDEAERLVRECVDLRTRLGANDWTTFGAKSLLGEVLLAQKKPEQAEALLTAGYDGLKSRTAAIPWDRRDALPAAAGRLARLYETTGDKDKAADWKKVERQERGKK